MTKDLNLTPKELLVLQSLASANNVKQTAILLHLSEKTVEYHRSRIVEKAGLGKAGHTQAALVHLALALGLLPKNDPKTGPVETLKPGELQEALLVAAKRASLGTADPLQVGALCQCAAQLIDLARLQMQVHDKLMEVEWLGQTVKKLAEKSP